MDSAPPDREHGQAAEHQKADRSVGFYSRLELNVGIRTHIGADGTEEYALAGVSIGAQIVRSFVLGASVSTSLVPTAGAFKPLYLGPVFQYYPTSLRGLGLGMEGGYLQVHDFSGFYLSAVVGWDWPLGETSSHRLGVGAKVMFEKLVAPFDFLPALSPSIVVRYSYF